MKSTWLIAVLSLLVAGGGFADDSAFDPQMFIVPKFVLILGSFKSFHEAHKQALAISQASKVPFSLRGMIFDKRRGLILPDNDEDEIYAGSYVHRRYNTARLHAKETEYISIERSDAYPTFAPKLYIVVGGIYNDSKASRSAVDRFKPIVPDVYAKKTKIYMGCIH